MANLLKVLLSASEKSANIARAWIAQEELFSLLVEEKIGEAKNQRFVQDFKTLADVLVQEVVKHEVSRRFPELKGHILGEESNLFTNSQGDSISVNIQESPAATANLLSQVLGGNVSAAQMLADIVHSNVAIDVDIRDLEDSGVNLELGDFGIWIDPIDGTAEYMSRSRGTYEGGILSRGLPCATILIGVFNYTTGKPVAGVVNQPFARFDEDSQTWFGQKVWGYSNNGLNFSSVKEYQQTKCTNNNDGTSKSSDCAVAISASESDSVNEKLKSAGIIVHKMSAVGYKLLKVIDKTVNAYVLSKESSFKWDTCAAHAILQTLGGGVVAYKNALQIVSECSAENFEELFIEKIKKAQLLYHKPDNENAEIGKMWSNSEGLVAFRSYDDLLTIIKAMI